MGQTVSTFYSEGTQEKELGIYPEKRRFSADHRLYLVRKLSLSPVHRMGSSTGCFFDGAIDVMESEVKFTAASFA